MKTTQNYFKSIIVITSLTFGCAHGVTFNVNNVQGLRNAIQQAKNNGGSIDTIIFNGGGRSFNDGGTIRVDTPVIIDGMDRNNTIIFNGDNSNSIFQIASSNVTIKNLTVRGSDQGLGFGIDDVWNVEISGCNITRNNAGILSLGGVPKNLTVAGNSFIDNGAGIWLLRDVGRPQSTNPLWGGKYVIRGNWLRGALNRPQTYGFNIDNGNDGVDYINGQVVRNNPAYTGGPLSGFSTGYAEGSEISYNIIERVNFHGISLSKTINIDIRNNNVTMTGGSGFGTGIHLEHRTNQCTIVNNTINTGGSGKRGIALLSFSDNGQNAFYSEGCFDLFVNDNVVTGPGIVFSGEGFRNVRVFRNNFTNSSKRVFNRNIQGGQNQFSQNWGNAGMPNGQIPVVTP